MLYVHICRKCDKFLGHFFLKLRKQSKTSPSFESLAFSCNDLGNTKPIKFTVYM